MIKERKFHIAWNARGVVGRYVADCTTMDVRLQADQDDHFAALNGVLGIIGAIITQLQHG